VPEGVQVVPVPGGAFDFFAARGPVKKEQGRVRKGKTARNGEKIHDFRTRKRGSFMLFQFGTLSFLTTLKKRGFVGGGGWGGGWFFLCGFMGGGVGGGGGGGFANFGLGWGGGVAEGKDKEFKDEGTGRHKGREKKKNPRQNHPSVKKGENFTATAGRDSVKRRRGEKLKGGKNFGKCAGKGSSRLRIRGTSLYRTSKNSLLSNAEKKKLTAGE